MTKFQKVIKYLISILTKFFSYWNRADKFVKKAEKTFKKVKGKK